MKKILACVVLIVSGQTLHAQNIVAGTVLLGGSIGYSQSNNEGSSIRNPASGPGQNTSSSSTGK
jgi:hypothetical protein